MTVISNGTNLINNGTLDSAIPTGKMTLIKTLTASGSSTLSFVDGADSVVFRDTYDIYVFKFINIHPANDGVQFQVGFRDAGTAYDAIKTTTFFQALHSENDANAEVGYTSSLDLAQSTGFQPLCESLGSDADQNVSGELTIYNPASTTFVKHFLYSGNETHSNDKIHSAKVSGYCNLSGYLDGVQFKMSSGNIDSGQILLFGIGG
jgi:hypothetical protein